MPRSLLSPGIKLLDNGKESLTCEQQLDCRMVTLPPRWYYAKVLVVERVLYEVFGGAVVALKQQGLYKALSRLHGKVSWKYLFDCVMKHDTKQKGGKMVTPAT